MSVDLDLGQLAKLCDGVPGPRVWRVAEIGGGEYVVADAVGRDGPYTEDIAHVENEDDAAFIAAANPDVVRELLSRAEALEKVREALEKVRALCEERLKITREVLGDTGFVPALIPIQDVLATLSPESEGAGEGI